MDTLSPALEGFLAEMEYPALKEDLVREAARDGLPPADVDLLSTLPEASYDARCRVRDALRATGALAGVAA